MAARPAAVRVATALMVLVGVGYLVDAAMLVVGAGAYPDRLREAAIEAGVDSRALDLVGGLAAVLPYVVGAVTGAAGVVLLVLAGSVHAGHFAGRIIAWVAAGMALLCSGCAGAAGRTPAFSGIGVVSAESSDVTGTQRFQQRLPEGYSEVYQLVSGAVAGFAAVALIAVTVLLALPAANRFFRARPPDAPAGPPPVPPSYPPGPPSHHPPGPPPGNGPAAH